MVRAHASKAPGPVAASPTISIESTGAQAIRMASRRSGWSSTTTTRIRDSSPPPGRLGTNRSRGLSAPAEVPFRLSLNFVIPPGETKRRDRALRVSTLGYGPAATPPILLPICDECS